MRRSWAIDAAVYAYMLLWMAFSYSTIQTTGSSPAVVIASFVMGFVGVVYLMNEKISYLEWRGLVVKMQHDDPDRPPHERAGSEDELDREKYR